MRLGDESPKSNMLSPGASSQNNSVVSSFRKFKKAAALIESDEDELESKSKNESSPVPQTHRVELEASFGSKTSNAKPILKSGLKSGLKKPSIETELPTDTLTVMKAPAVTKKSMRFDSNLEASSPKETSFGIMNRPGRQAITLGGNVEEKKSALKKPSSRNMKASEIVDDTP